MVDERHPIQAAPEVKAQVLADFAAGTKESQFGRRKLVRTTLFGALALVPLSGVVLLRDLGPLPGDKLRHSKWKAGSLIINENTMQPLRPEDITVGSLTQPCRKGSTRTITTSWSRSPSRGHAGPPGAEGHQGPEVGRVGPRGHPVLLQDLHAHRLPGHPVRAADPPRAVPLPPVDVRPRRRGRVLFGPAGHPLPQLRITVNDDGYLEALGDFEEPPGPSFWERG